MSYGSSAESGMLNPGENLQQESELTLAEFQIAAANRLRHRVLRRLSPCCCVMRRVVRRPLRSSRAIRPIRDDGSAGEEDSPAVRPGAGGVGGNRGMITSRRIAEEPPFYVLSRTTPVQRKAFELRGLQPTLQPESCTTNRRHLRAAVPLTTSSGRNVRLRPMFDLPAHHACSAQSLQRTSACSRTSSVARACLSGG